MVVLYFFSITLLRASAAALISSAADSGHKISACEYVAMTVAAPSKLSVSSPSSAFAACSALRGRTISPGYSTAVSLRAVTAVVSTDSLPPPPEQAVNSMSMPSVSANRRTAPFLLFIFCPSVSYLSDRRTAAAIVSDAAVLFYADSRAAEAPRISEKRRRRFRRPPPIDNNSDVATVIIFDIIPHNPDMISPSYDITLQTRQPPHPM